MKIYINLALIMLLAVSPATAQDDSTAVLYKAESVYTMSGEPISPGQVLVAGGKIKSVGKSIAPDVRQNAEVVDLGPNSVLMPGLIDAYTQAGLVEDGSDEFSQETTPNFRTVHAIDWKSTDMKRRAHDGTTTMCVCPGTQNVISGIASIVKTAGDNVIDDDYALVATLCSDPTARNIARRRPDSIYVRLPTNRMGVVWLFRNTFSKVERNKVEYDTVDQVLAGVRPLFVVSRTSHDLRTVTTLADEFGFVPILVGGHESYKVTDLIVDRNYTVILSGTTTGSIDGPERTELCWNQAGVLDQAGINFSISGSNQLEQARFAHRFGLKPLKALQAITIAPAKILGIDGRVGTIASGKDADMIALTGDPLEFTTGIKWVMVDGKIINRQNADGETKGK